MATGPVAAGTVGSAGRQTYTLYGDTVNLAQRLEELNKELETDCLITATTLQAAPEYRNEALPRGEVQLRGRKETVGVFAFAGNDFTSTTPPYLESSSGPPPELERIL